jgi:hypothetical protein
MKESEEGRKWRIGNERNMPCGRMGILPLIAIEVATYPQAESACRDESKYKLRTHFEIFQQIKLVVFS